MFHSIRQYFVRSFRAIIRKGAVMSESDARRNRLLAFCAPVLLFVFLYNEITEPSETIVMKCLVWWLIGMMVLGMTVLPISLYGFHHRNDIDTSGEEPHDYRPGIFGAALGTALVPLALLLFDYFGFF
jgi:hypothetical protein